MPNRFRVWISALVLALSGPGFCGASSDSMPSCSLTKGPPLPLPVSSFGAATSGDALYVYGGHGGKTHSYSTESTSGNFYRWSPQSFGLNEWEELPSNVHVQGLALVSHKGSLYRIGGMRPRNAPGESSDNHSVATTGVFDPIGGEWEEFVALPEARSSLDAAVWGDQIIVVGGWKMNGPTSNPIWYDTALMLDLAHEAPSWKEIPQPFQRRALACAVLKDSLYVVGGLTSDGEIETCVDILDLETKEWSKGPTLPGRRFNGFTPAVCTLGDTLYANPSDGHLYRLNVSSWEQITTIEEPRFVHRMLPLAKGQIAILGGASNEGNRSLTEIVNGLALDTKSRDKVHQSRTNVSHGSGTHAQTSGQTHCPVMRSDFVYEDSVVVEYQGVSIRLCCHTCAEKWNAEPEAYLDREILPQLRDVETPHRKIEQVFCPIYQDRVVSSKDPNTEHDGKLIYFFNESAKRRFLKKSDH